MTNTKIPELSSLIKDKKFDFVNPDIREGLFPTPKEIGTEYELVHFDRHILSEDAVKELEKDGWRPATAWDLLSWKGWNDKDFVIALGSVGEVDGGRRVACLGEGSSGRRLSLGRWDGAWDAHCRFLRVRKSSLSNSDTQKNDTMSLGNLKKRVSELERKLAEISKILK